MTDKSDLKRLVQSKLRRNVHGKQFDLLYDTVRTPQMLGCKDIYGDETIFDPNHEFWQEYDESFDTRSETLDEIQETIGILKEEGVFRKTYPRGEEANIVYCEVDPVETGESITLPCKECDGYVDASLSFRPSGSSYEIVLSVDCEYCDHSGEFSRPLFRQ